MGREKPITQLGIPPRDTAGLGILAAGLIGQWRGRAGFVAFESRGTRFPCLGATPEICHACDSKMQTNRAKPIGGSVSVRGKPGIGQAFFFAKGNNTNTAASQLSQKVSFQASTGQSQHNEFAAHLIMIA